MNIHMRTCRAVISMWWRPLQREPQIPGISDESPEIVSFFSFSLFEHLTIDEDRIISPPMQIYFKKKKQQRDNFGCLHYFTLKQNNEIISQKAKTSRGRIIIHFGLQFSLHRPSVGLKSGLCAGHSVKFTLVFSKNDVCFKLLSSWKTKRSLHQKWHYYLICHTGSIPVQASSNCFLLNNNS